MISNIVTLKNYEIVYIIIVHNYVIFKAFQAICKEDSIVNELVTLF
jgi:hypothetical protein